MKKVYWKTIISVLVLTLFIFLALGSGDSSDVDRGDGDNATEVDSSKKTDNDKDKISIQKDYTVNGLKITIGEIELHKDKVVVGITLKNKTENTLSFYPDQGNAVMGSMQLEGNMFMTEGDISGDIHGGVTKSGVLFFTAPEDKELPKEKSITLHLGDVYDEDSFSAKEFKATLSLE